MAASATTVVFVHQTSGTARTGASTATSKACKAGDAGAAKYVGSTGSRVIAVSASQQTA